MKTKKDQKHKNDSSQATSGRPRTASFQMPSYGNVTICAAATGIPRDVLLSAKSSGCPAFRNSRVYLDEFIRWYFTQSDGLSELLDGAQEKAKLDKARRMEIERENALAEGEIHTLEQVEQTLWTDWLIHVREAWTAYPKTTGIRLRSILVAAGVAQDVIEAAVKEACDGVTEPVERLNKNKPND